MNNILKLLLGVIALSGLVAFLVPSASPVSVPVTSAPSMAAPPPPSTLPVIQEDGGAAGEEEELEGEDAEEEEFKMGEPSIDGQPFGGSYDPPSRNQNTERDQSADPSQDGPPPPPNNGIILQ